MFACVCFADPSGFHGSYNENMKKKNMYFTFRLKLSKFAADADIYTMQFWCF